MTATQKFIQDAEEGGWKAEESDHVCILLDPLAWQAVGKMRGWGGFDDTYFITADLDIRFNYINTDVPLISQVERMNQENRVKYRIGKAVSIARTDDWQAHMHLFIDHLTDGRTVEEALAALSSTT